MQFEGGYMYSLPKITFFSDTISIIKKNQFPVAVFGSGRLGRMTVDILKDMGILPIYIFDNNTKLHGNFYSGIEIISPTNVDDKDIYVVLAIFDSLIEIENQVKELGFHNIIPYYFCFIGQEINAEMYWDNDGSIQESEYLSAKKSNQDNPEFLEINSLDIVITEKCSLKCKNCANLNQYYKNPRDEDITLNFKAMNRLFNCVDLVGRLSILGGEPLVCSKVTDYILECSKYDNICSILVVSNGTIMPSDSLIDAIKQEQRSLLSISDYGNLSRHKKEIIDDSFQNNYKISVSRRAEGIWRELGRIEYIDLNTDELEEKWNQCMMKKYLMIKGGKLFVCPFAANAYSLQAIDKKDVFYVDLIDDSVSNDDLHDKIRCFLLMNRHNECKYCIEKGKRANIIPAAEQTKEPIEYKKYEY
jgi:organic radical activating enzyme